MDEYKWTVVKLVKQLLTETGPLKLSEIQDLVYFIDDRVQEKNNKNRDILFDIKSLLDEICRDKSSGHHIYICIEDLKNPLFERFDWKYMREENYRVILGLLKYFLLEEN